MHHPRRGEVLEQQGVIAVVRSRPVSGPTEMKSMGASDRAIRRGIGARTLLAAATVLIPCWITVIGCGGTDQSAVDQAVATQRIADGKAAAQFGALTIRLFVSLSALEVMSTPEIFTGGLPAATSMVRGGAAEVRGDLEQIAQVHLAGNRFALQQSTVVEGIRACLGLVDGVVAEMAAGNPNAGARAALPITECWVAVRDRYVRLGLQ